ncbi:hypothetical protein MMC15_001977 [Xylographa vitiligo]|nr:hypothetical protein [Xylographa vitiligo]
MPPSTFDDFLSDNIETSRIEFEMPTLAELSPPLPPVIPGTERLLWVKQYRQDFKEIKATNVKMKGGIEFCQRVMTRSLLKLAQKDHELASIKKELENANQLLARANDIFGNVHRRLAEKDAVIAQGARMVAELRMTTFGHGGIAKGTLPSY